MEKIETYGTNDTKLDIIGLKKWIKRDYIYIILILISIITLLWFVAGSKQYMNDCNEHWREQMEVCECLCIGGNYTQTYNYITEPIRIPEGEPT